MGDVVEKRRIPRRLSREVCVRQRLFRQQLLLHRLLRNCWSSSSNHPNRQTLPRDHVVVTGTPTVLLLLLLQSYSYCSSFSVSVDLLLLLLLIQRHQTIRHYYYYCLLFLLWVQKTLVVRTVASFGPPFLPSAINSHSQRTERH